MWIPASCKSRSISAVETSKKISPCQDLRIGRQRFDLVQVRAQRVEDSRTGREKQVGPAGFRYGNSPSNRQLAAARVAPDRSPERHHGKLQTPAATPDGYPGGKDRTGEIDLARDAGMRVIDLEG